jgi:ABC-2 type transport system permease protein
MSLWRIVARREFVERARDRGFAISTAITLLILIGVIVLNALFNRGTTFDIAVQGSGTLGRKVVLDAAALGIEVRVVPVATEAAAERAVREGRVDAAVLGEEILVESEGDPRLIGVIQAVSGRTRTEGALHDAGLSDEEVADILTQPPLQVRALEPFDARRRENAAVAFVGVLILYGQLIAYGYWVASGVAEEKSSRVIEVLIAAVRPSELLRGKIFGIGSLGLAQLLVIGVVGLGTSIAIGTLEFPSGAIVAIGLALFWFVLGFFFYAGLFAVAGALVTRQEDLQTTMTPLTIVIVGSFFIGISAASDPSSTLALIASLLPFSAPLVMPTRIVLGEASAAEVVLSILISIASTAALIPLATRIYSRALLQSGRVKLRAVLRRA